MRTLKLLGDLVAPSFSNQHHVTIFSFNEGAQMTEATHLLPQVNRIEARLPVTAGTSNRRSKIYVPVLLLVVSAALVAAVAWNQRQPFSTKSSRSTDGVLLGTANLASSGGGRCADLFTNKVFVQHSLVPTGDGGGTLVKGMGTIMVPSTDPGVFRYFVANPNSELVHGPYLEYGTFELHTIEYSETSSCRTTFHMNVHTTNDKEQDQQEEWIHDQNDFPMTSWDHENILYTGEQRILDDSNRVSMAAVALRLTGKKCKKLVAETKEIYQTVAGMEIPVPRHICSK